mgnify:CR=1 FL=1
MQSAPSPTPLLAPSLGPDPRSEADAGTLHEGHAIGLLPDGTALFLRRAACVRPGSECCRAAREYTALSHIASGSAPRAVSLLRTHGACCVVTEFVRGLDARSAVAAGADPVRLILQVLLTLRRSHSLGWVHGDVKPSNILVQLDGRVVLTDWELVHRAGEACPPGTLGYAPPYAWEPGHEASEVNDVYALAVTAAELLTGAQLFSGDRSAIVAAQLVARLADYATLAPDLAGLFEAADARKGGPPPRSLDSSWTLREERDRERVLDAVVRADVRKSVKFARRTSASIEIETPFEDAAQSVYRVVAEQWRTTHGENAVTLDEITQGVEETVCGNSGASQTDAMRAAIARRLDSVVSALARMRPGVVIAPAVPSGAVSTIAKSVLASELDRRGDSESRWRIVDVRVTVCQADSGRAQVRQGVREAVTVAFGARLVSPAVSEVLVRLRPQRALDVVAVAASLIRSGDLELRGAAIEANHRDGRLMQRAAGALRETHDHAEWSPGTVDSASAASATALIASAEESLLLGDPESARRSVNAGIQLLRSESAKQHIGDWMRAIDALVEVGDSEQALAVLEELRGCLPGDEWGRRVGRIAAMNLHLAGLNMACEVLRSAGRPETDLELARFGAIALRCSGDVRAAIRLLRRSIRASVDERRWQNPGLADALGALGDILRGSGRSHSAVRVLCWARTVADWTGAVLAGVRIETNLLLATEAVGDGGQGGSAWEALGARCERWGLRSEARRNWTRAAMSYVDRDRCDEAARALDAAQSIEGAGCGTGVWRAIEDAVTQACRSRADAPLPIASIPQPTDLSRVHWRNWVAYVADEHGHRETMNMGELRAGLRGRAGVVRSARALFRWVVRGGDSLCRVRVAFMAFAREGSTSSPCVGAVCRVLARSGTENWTLESLLKEVRQLAESAEYSPSSRSVALALHAQALVWGNARSMESARWFRCNGGESERARPFGVSAWEWKLAIALSDRVLGDDTEADQQAEVVVAAVREWMRALRIYGATARADVVPYDVIAEAAGLNAAQALAIEPGDERLTALQAHLRTESVRFRGSRGRAAGLERVLRTALRLRSCDSVDSVLREVVAGVVAVTRTERAVAVVELEGSAACAKVATDELIEDIRIEDAEVSRSAIEHVRACGRAVVFDDACGDAGLGESPSVRLYRPRSLMIAPLYAHGVYLGFVYVENRTLPRSFSPSDSQLLEGFAAQAALALENARLVQELRASLEELRRIRAEAVRAESLRVLGQLAGEVAHDFNNLLAVVLGETQILLQDGVRGEVRRSLEVVERAALDGAAVIKRIQSSTRSAPKEEFVRIDLARLVREVIDFTRVRWSARRGSRRGEVVAVVECAEGAHVRGFAPELREVFTNIVLNAVDAMSAGGNLSVRCTVADGEVRVSVKDTGDGIPADVMDRIFDPFFSTKGERGNGLGLAIAREIVERHGGEIVVESVVGEGTDVCVVLPEDGATCESVVAVRSEVASPTTVVRGDGRRALVVDDEEGVRRVLGTMLESLGFAVTNVACGSAVLELLREGSRFELLVTDVHMPQMSGIEVAEHVQKSCPSCTIVVMTGYGLDIEDVQIGGARVDCVLAKPFTLDDVRRVVARASTAVS